MQRLSRTLLLDLKLVQRYGIVYAALFIIVLWIVLLRILGSAFPDALSLAVPFVILLDISTFGFFFLAGMILFERGDNVLNALFTSPLRDWEYLGSKIGVQLLLSLGIALVVTLATLGTAFHSGALFIGTFLASLVALLLAIVAVAPFKSISAFIIPSQVYVIGMLLPALALFGLFDNIIMTLMPTYGAMSWLKASTVAVDTTRLMLGTATQLIWVGVLAVWARRRFRHHVLGHRVTQRSSR